MDDKPAPKQVKLKERIQHQVKNKKRGTEFTPDSFSNYMDENLQIRKQKLKLAEMKVKARVAIKGGITDEDRAHKLKMQEVKLMYELEKEKLKIELQREELKVRQIEAECGLNVSRPAGRSYTLDHQRFRQTMRLMKRTPIWEGQVILMEDPSFYISSLQTSRKRHHYYSRVVLPVIFSRL